MPAPLPKTSRPPPLIFTNPLPGKALAAAISSVPPLTDVPPEYVFAPVRINSPLPEIVSATLPWELDSVEFTMFPANVVAPDVELTVNVAVYVWLLTGLRLFMMIAPAAPLRLPTGCGFPPKSSAAPAAMLKAVVAGRL